MPEITCAICDKPLDNAPYHLKVTTAADCLGDAVTEDLTGFARDSSEPCCGPACARILVRRRELRSQEMSQGS